MRNGDLLFNEYRISILQDEKSSGGDVPAVQWLRLCISSSGGAGMIPDQETKILATCHMA